MTTHAPYSQWSEGTSLALAVGAETVSLSPAHFTVPNAGYGAQFTASAVGADGMPLASSYAWTSTNLAVATVSPTGVVRTIGAGMAIIRATAPSGAYAESLATVGVVALLKQDGEPWKTIQAMHGGPDLTEASAGYVYTGGEWVKIL